MSHIKSTYTFLESDFTTPVDKSFRTYSCVLNKRPAYLVILWKNPWIHVYWHYITMSKKHVGRNCYLVTICSLGLYLCYNLRPKLSTKSCFVKQKCQLQISVAHYKNPATPLSTLGINTTHQHFQIKDLKRYKPK